MKNLILTLAMLITTAAHADIHKYECVYKDGDADPREVIKLKVNTANAMIAVKYTDADYTDYARYDSSYTPRYNVSYYRYFVVKSGSPSGEYTPEYIVAKALTRGAETGYLKFQARGEGYFGGTYACTLEE